jgi:hypothetical protein
MLALIVALTAVSVQAQTSSNRLKFTVPFEFNVGSEVLPAGDYTVSVENQTVRLQKTDGKANMIALSQRTVSARDTDSKVKLMFRQYGGHAYLSQVWLGDGLGRDLRRPKVSDALAQNSRVVEVKGQAR